MGERQEGGAGCGVRGGRVGADPSQPSQKWFGFTRFNPKYKWGLRSCLVRLRDDRKMQEGRGQLPLREGGRGCRLGQVLRGGTLVRKRGQRGKSASAAMRTFLMSGLRGSSGCEVGRESS